MAARWFSWETKGILCFYPSMRCIKTHIERVYSEHNNNTRMQQPHLRQACNNPSPHVDVSLGERIGLAILLLSTDWLSSLQTLTIGAFLSMKMVFVTAVTSSSSWVKETLRFTHFPIRIIFAPINYFSQLRFPISARTSSTSIMTGSALQVVPYR